MTKVVNLRQFRKRKAREAEARLAAENRLRHGRTPAERRRDEALEADARRRMDQLQRERPEPQPAAPTGMPPEAPEPDSR